MVAIEQAQLSFMDVAKAFYQKTRDQSTFSSDDLRRLGFDAYLDGRNAIGGFMCFLVKNRFSSEVGRIPSTFPSTHGRRVGLYIWTSKGREALK